ncbi:MAG: alpha/beta fold hydrolase [Gemmatimonadota bacterium]
MNRTPVGDDLFAQIADLYRYDADQRLEAVTIGQWPHRLPYVIEKIAYRSTHGERVPGFFAHPQDTTGARYPAVLLVHGANGFWGKSEDWAMDWLDLLARSGRCVLAIDNAAFGERRLEPGEPWSWGPYRYRDWMVQTVTDQRRGVDYLLSRPEVDGSRIALLGGSMGGHIGCLVAGLEDRFAAVVLTVVGAWVEGPTGDGRGPGEELFRAMPARRQQIWYESSHYLPPRQYSTDIMVWLDAHL